jgi:hypothetical protein
VSAAYRQAQVHLAIDLIGRTASPITVLAATFGPFPGKYALTFDAAKSASLSTCVNDTLLGTAAHPGGVIGQARAAGAKSADTFATALVDLTGGPAAPAYAGFFDEETFYVGSMAKVAPMYAAHELRLRIQRLVNAVKAAGLATTPQWRQDVLSAIRAVWSRQICTGFPGLDTRFPQRFPKLDQIFTITPAGNVTFTTGGATQAQITSVGEFGTPAGPTMKFFEWMTLMILWSSNTAASMVIDAIGFPYINGVLREAGFFHPATKRGIWISGNFRNDEWKKGVDYLALSPRGKKHYKATTNFVGDPLEFARLLALAALHRLFDGDVTTCDDMILMMRKGVVPGMPSFIANSLANVDSVSSKIGVGNASPGPPGLAGAHDCAIINRHQGGKVIRYVAVVAGGYSADAGAEPLAFGNVVQTLDGCILSAH